MWLHVGCLIRKEKMSHERTLEAVIKYVELEGYDWSDITGPCRLAHFVEIRHMIMHFMRNNGFGYVHIGRVMKRNHATAIHATKKVSGYLDVDSQFRSKYDKFENGITSSQVFATEV